MQWGAWATGMAASKAMQTHLERVGVGILHPIAGINALRSVISRLSSSGTALISYQCFCCQSTPTFRKESLAPKSSTKGKILDLVPGVCHQFVLKQCIFSAISGLLRKCALGLAAFEAQSISASRQQQTSDLTVLISRTVFVASEILLRMHSFSSTTVWQRYNAAKSYSPA